MFPNYTVYNLIYIYFQSDQVAIDNENVVPNEVIKITKKVKSDKLSHKEKKKLKKEVNFLSFVDITQIIVALY